MRTASGQAALTLGQLWQEFTGSGEGRAALKGEDSARLRRFIVWCGMRTVPDTVVPHQIEEFLQQQSTSTTSPRAYLPPLKAFFTFVAARGATNVNPMKQVRLPRGQSRARMVAAAARSTAEGEQQVPLTRERLAELEGELARLIHEERPRVLRDLQEARRDGDLRENSAYDDARKEQGMVEGRIQELERIVRNAVVIEEAAPTETAGIGIGSRVEIENLNGGRRRQFLVVSPEETDPRHGKLSHLSPVGKSVMGRHVGDTVEVATPRGTTRYRIVSTS